MRIKGGTAIALAFASLIGCVERKSEIFVPVPIHQSTLNNTALSKIESRPVFVDEFKSLRGTGLPSGRIGERTAINDISMGYVSITPPPERLLREAIVSELKSAGHTTQSDDARVRIEGKVASFSLRTEVTAAYWDVIVEVALILDLKNSYRKSIKYYYEKCSDRTYSWPSSRLISKVTYNCVSNIALQFNMDKDIADMIGE